MKTFEILLASEKTTIRTTRDGLFSWISSSRPDATLVKTGYTTSWIYSGGKCVGSVQEIG